MTVLNPLFAISAQTIGITLTLIIIGLGLAWLFWRSFSGKEVDRRIIFIFIFFSVAAPILFKISFTFKAIPIVSALYDKVESLPAGSTVLISYDFDPAMAPEVQPMADALSRHCLSRDLKIIYMCLFPTGQGQLEETFRTVVREEFPNKKDGIDFVNLGYKAGGEGVLNVIVTDFEKMFPTDVNSVPYGDIQVFDNIKSCQNLDLIISIGGGRPGIKEWVLFVGDPGNVPMAAGVAAVVAPQLYPYFPNQILGLLGGVKGAAEYENKMRDEHEQFKDMPTPATTMMGPQTLAHIVVMAFIIIGNILYFRNKRREEG